ncbi:pectate lyase family protein [Kaistella palustris]|uniref:pectate lyase family protein n=1 Tax=Kaistella palustris TaxID=493376 RepID=UPI001F25105B|nr:T9SS type A sorting domain-containing protein [Kaistella palustris]
MALFLMSLGLEAQSVTITQQTGWLESAYVQWTPVEGAQSYNVYYSGQGVSDQKIDTQLIRSYGSYFRADALGLAAGVYTMKVVPVIGGTEGDATVSAPVTVVAHDRTGFAYRGGRLPGAYKFDGTLKDNAQIIYVTQNTKNTVSLNVTGATTNPCVGLQNILDGFKKGSDSRPLVVRMIGNITDLSNMQSGDIVVENKNNANGSITIEGVGSDAVANGWGIRIKNASNIEIRNIGFMLTDSNEGDNVGLQQGNDHIWVHNCDMFYGAAGGDADQAKGDGALDCKKSTDVTFSYNHFWDSGKSNLLGLSEGSMANLYITYHHNWYDHSDSRHPRVRYYSAHVYNNYYDGNSKYGAGSTMASSVFMEGNFFRACKYPMLTSMQGSDVYNGAQGTFSSEAGGVIKAFNNVMSGQQRFVGYDPVNYPVEFDAYVSATRNEVVPNTIKSKKGGNTYNNFDTDPTLYISSLVIDEPEVARDKTMMYAGRVSGGDISFAFNNAVDDASYAVNAALKALLLNYTTQLVYVQGEDPVNPSSQTLTVPNNNDQTVITGTAISDMVFTWGGTATDATVIGLPAAGITAVKDMAAQTITVSGTPTEDVSFTVVTSGPTGTPVEGSGNISVEEPGSQGNQIHNFTVSGLNSTFYTFTGANMNSTPGNTTYDGLILTARMKMESATIVSYDTMEPSKLTLVFDPTFSGKVKIDNATYYPSNGVLIIPSLAAGSHTIKKGDTTNLYYIKTEFTTLAADAATATAKAIKVYPNPVTDVLNLVIPAEEKVTQVSVFNMAGQQMKTFSGGNTSLNLQNLTAGLYLVKIQTTKGVHIQKIIKK